MSKRYSEDIFVQEKTAQFLVDEMGWDESVLAWDEETLGTNGTLGRKSQKEVILTRYLEAALRRLNPGLPDAFYVEAIAKISSSNPAQTLVANNKTHYQQLREGVTVGKTDSSNADDYATLRVFDFENPAHNHFLVVRELWVDTGLYGRIRPDILGYVNGIPLLFMELKRFHKSVQAAYTQNYVRYRAQAPSLFYHNAFVMLSNGDEGRVGTITSPFTYFNEWKRLTEEEAGSVGFEMMLRGMCDRASFLDLFENFILFDDSKPAGRNEDGSIPRTHTRKILARNHQFLGVNQAFAAVQERGVREGKLGVFWHTQGSGKSYSMVFLAQKIHRKLRGNFTFLVLTDRTDLDTQIYKTFVGVGAVSEKDAARATSGEDLRQKLGGNPRYIFSLIQKFNLPVAQLLKEGVYSQRDNIIVFSDEAHRTQYGALADNMRHALPHASYMGFTGTPLMGNSAEDQLTRDIFGDYISTYDFQRAVEDGSTVPLYYDNRGHEMQVTVAQLLKDQGEDLNTRVAEIIDEYGLEEDAEQRLRRVLGTHYLILTSRDRLERIAADFVAHYVQRWETGKAMMICLDRPTCVRMHQLIEEKWREAISAQRRAVKQARDEQDLEYQERKLAWLQETERVVVISKSADEVAVFSEWGMTDEILRHRALLESRVNLEEEFKDDSYPFRVAIVCAMWLTGFDVESLATLYVDKPMRSHTLMQAIARANRVHEGKANGLIVDYNGILASLRQALARYASFKRGGATVIIDPAPPQEELLPLYAADVQACSDYLMQLGFDLDTLLDAFGFDENEAILTAVNLLNRTDDTRARFEVLAREMARKRKSLIGEPGVFAYEDDYNALTAIYKKLTQQNRDTTNIIAALREIQAEVDEAITLAADARQPGEASGKIYDISKINFERLRQEFDRSKHKNTVLQTLKQQVEAKLRRMVAQNPTRLDLLERYQEIIAAYNREMDRVTIEQTFEALLNLVISLTEEETRAAREGFDNEQQLAAFDLLVVRHNDLSTAKRNQVKALARELMNKIEAAIAGMDNWIEKEGTKAQVRNLIHDELYPALPTPEFDDDIDDLAQELFRHVFMQYTQVE